MEKLSGRRFNAGITRNLNKNYIWPEKFGSVKPFIKNNRNKGSEFNRIDCHEYGSHVSGSRSKNISRHFSHTTISECSKSSIEIKRTRVELKTEKAKHVLLNETLKE